MNEIVKMKILWKYDEIENDMDSSKFRYLKILKRMEKGIKGKGKGKGEKREREERRGGDKRGGKKG